MKIIHLAIPPDRIAHIAKHSVAPEEVREAAFDDPECLIQRLKATTSGPERRIYRLLGRTEAGTYLAERRYYLERKG